MPKDTPNLWKIIPQSSQNHPKSIPWADFGAKIPPSRLHVCPFSSLRRQLSFQSPTLVPPWVPKCVQNRAFALRLALQHSKNDLRKGVCKKHEHFIINQSKKQYFLKAQNHVWRYTLRLFYTFGLFGKIRKIDAEMAPKIYEKSSKR